MDELSLEVEWSQILCSLVGFTKTNTEGVNLVLRHQFLCTQKFWWTTGMILKIQLL